MIKKIRSERWKEIKEVKGKLRLRYVISDHGRLVSFHKKIDDGQLLNCGRQGKFFIWRYKFKDKNKAVLIHILVARHFLPKPKGRNKLVIHLDHDLENNNYKNLKYVTLLEQRQHGSRSPASRAALRKLQLFNRKRTITKGQKLTVVQVKHIKEILANPRRKLTHKQLAEKFKVSQMQIYRIKRGEIWKRVKI